MCHGCILGDDCAAGRVRIGRVVLYDWEPAFQFTLERSLEDARAPCGHDPWTVENRRQIAKWSSVSSVRGWWGRCATPREANTAQAQVSRAYAHIKHGFHDETSVSSELTKHKGVLFVTEDLYAGQVATVQRPLPIAHLLDKNKQLLSALRFYVFKRGE